MDWIITEDCLGHEPLEPVYNRLAYGHYNDQWAIIAKTTPNPESRPALIREHLDQATSNYPFEFRLLDDDGEVYYLGRCGDLDLQDEEHAFAPLDWAMADAGCTTMEYRRVGEDEWRTL